MIAVHQLATLPSKHLIGMLPKHWIDKVPFTCDRDMDFVALLRKSPI